MTLVCVLLAAVTLAVFWPVTHCDFINLDDPGYFSANPHVLGGLRWDNVLWSWHTSMGSNWHPLTWLSLMLDATLFGPGPRGPHLVNLLLHAANAVLLLLLLHRMTGARWRSAVAALLFALHPLRVESVAWVSERKDVLSGLFFLLTLWAYAHYAAARKRDPESRITGHASGVHLPSSILYLLSLSCFALGLMSKPMLVTLPFVLLLLDYWPLQRFPPSTKNSKLKTLLPLLLEKTPFFLLSGISCGVTFWAQGQGGAMADWGALPLAARVQNALVSYARYLGKTFWPVDLAIVYPHPDYWPWKAVLAATILVVVLASAVLWYACHRPYLVTGWFWWLGTLVPVLGLVQVGVQAMADRYTYLPAIGLFAGLVWGAEALTRAWRLPTIVTGAGAVAVLACCCLRTTDQLRYWRDSEALFRHALACTSDNLFAHDNLGMALATQGKWAEAIEHYQQALRLRPGLASGHAHLADAFYAQGRRDEAIQHCQLALQSDPTHVGAHSNLGLVFAQQGQWTNAIAHYERALALQPTARSPRNNLAWLLATCPQAEFRNGTKAVELAQELNRLAGGNDRDSLDTLAAAYAEAGHFPQAVEAAERAVALAVAQAHPQAEEFRARLNLYLQGSPYHEPPPAQTRPR